MKIEDLTKHASHKVYRGEMKEAFMVKNKTANAVDGVLGWLLVGAVVIGSLVSFVDTLWGIKYGFSAFWVMRVCNDLCGVAIAFLVFIFWYSLTHYDHRMRQIMTKQTRVTPNGIMRGGFLPVPAAASAGLLLFFTTCFISESIQEGSLLQQKTAGDFLYWLDDLQRCRANSIENEDYLTAWFSRLSRTHPIASTSVLSKIGSLVSGEEKKDPSLLPGSCWGAMQDFGRSDVMTQTPSGKWEDKTDIKDLVNPLEEAPRKCMYQCVTWQRFNLVTILQSLGTIAVGAAAVVTLTEYISTSIGIAVVTEATSAEDLVKLTDRISPNRTLRRLTKPFRSSMLCSSLFVVGVYAILKFFLAAKINTDGFYTVDYYTTFLITFCVVLVTYLRCWHPFQCRPQVFTKPLWGQGIDVFTVPTEKLDEWNSQYQGVDPKKPEFKKTMDFGDLSLVKIDLYQWMQLTGHERTEMLINYCRRPTQGDQDTGSIVMPMADVKVELKNHESEKGHVTKILPKHQKLEVVKWESADVVEVKTRIDGKLEKVKLNNDTLVEDSPEWTDAIKKINKYMKSKSLMESVARKPLEAPLLESVRI